LGIEIVLIGCSETLPRPFRIVSLLWRFCLLNVTFVHFHLEGENRSKELKAFMV
jgi:hypothetical protein